MKFLPCLKYKHNNSIRRKEKIKVKTNGKEGKRRGCCG
jgi:hypothetical protein